MIDLELHRAILISVSELKGQEKESMSALRNKLEDTGHSLTVDELLSLCEDLRDTYWHIEFDISRYAGGTFAITSRLLLTRSGLEFLHETTPTPAPESSPIGF